MILEVDPKTLNPYSTPIDPLKEPFKEPYLLSLLPLQVSFSPQTLKPAALSPDRSLIEP